MTDSKTLARPAQVTMAAWVAIVGSVFVVFYAFGVVANLRTLETRERVEDTVSVPPASWLDLGVEGYLDLIHVASMVAAGCAVATAILGWHVLRRSRSARIALTILAVPLLFAGAFTDGFMSSMVAFSAVFLWLKPSRDWFDGITPAPRAVVDRPTPPTPVVGNPGPPPPAATQTPRPEFTTARPTEVVQACVVTWVFAGLVLLGSALMVMGVLVAPDAFREAWEDSAQSSDISFATAERAVLGAGTVFALWSLGAIVVAVFAMLGRNWARLVLLVSAASAGVVCLVSSSTGSFVLLIPFAACGAVVALLLRPSVVAWYTRRY